MMSERAYNDLNPLVKEHCGLPSYWHGLSVDLQDFLQRFVITKSSKEEKRVKEEQRKAEEERKKSEEKKRKAEEREKRLKMELNFIFRNS